MQRHAAEPLKSTYMAKLKEHALQPQPTVVRLMERTMSTVHVPPMHASTTFTFDNTAVACPSHALMPLTGTNSKICPG
jgi:hypothetical protein